MPPTPSAQAGKPTRLWLEFLKLFLPLCALAGLLLVLLGGSGLSLLRQRIATHETAVASTVKEVLETDLRLRISDAYFLSELAALHMDDHFRCRASEELRQIFHRFAKDRPSYDQVRLLDTTGQEILRVNAGADGPVLVPEAALQNKATRPYFILGIATPADIYASAFDLNVEKGVVETPRKPVLRFASPVRSPEGDPVGLVVLNFLGKRMLARIARDAAVASGSVWLVNQDGFWLRGPSPEDEWTFMFPDRKQRTVASRHPAPWQRMRAEGEGQFTADEGLFTFATVHMLAPDVDGTARRFHVQAEEEWMLITFVPADRLVPEWWPQARWLAFGTVLFLGLISLQWARYRRAKLDAEAAIRASEERLRSISDSAMDAIVMVDAEDRIVFWNPAAETLFGYTTEEILGQRLAPLLCSDDDTDEQDGACFFLDDEDAATSHREQTLRTKSGNSFPAELSLAPVRIRSAPGSVAVVRDITERKAAEEQLRLLATTDALTGLNNRRRFLELAQHEIDRAKRHGLPLSVMMFDLDHFKKVNDTHGHAAGDDVLRTIGQVCGQVLRDVDISGRLGGEEFAVLLPDTDDADAQQVAERLRATIEEQTIATEAGPLSVTASIGVAAIKGIGMDAEALLKEADAALYEAKESGRNRVVCRPMAC